MALCRVCNNLSSPTRLYCVKHRIAVAYIIHISFVVDEKNGVTTFGYMTGIVNSCVCAVCISRPNVKLRENNPSGCQILETSYSKIGSMAKSQASTTTVHVVDGFGCLRFVVFASTELITENIAR